MRVAIYGRKVSKHSAEYFIEMLKYLEDFGWEAVLEEDLKALLVSKIGISEKYQTFKSISRSLASKIATLVNHTIEPIHMLHLIIKR